MLLTQATLGATESAFAALLVKIVPGSGAAGPSLFHASLGQILSYQRTCPTRRPNLTSGDTTGRSICRYAAESSSSGGSRARHLATLSKGRALGRGGFKPGVAKAFAASKRGEKKSSAGSWAAGLSCVVAVPAVRPLNGLEQC